MDKLKCPLATAYYLALLRCSPNSGRI